MTPSHLERLRRSDGPWLYRLVASDSDASDLARSLELSDDTQSTAVRIIRGTKSRTADRFFDESAAALQFPSYFGENWDAFEECLGDLEWISGHLVVVLVSTADHLLDKEPDRVFRTLLQIAGNVERQWTNSDEPRRLCVILQVSRKAEPALTHRIQDAGVRCEALA